MGDYPIFSTYGAKQEVLNRTSQETTMKSELRRRKDNEYIADEGEFEKLGVRRYWLEGKAPTAGPYRGDRTVVRKFEYRCGAKAMVWVRRPFDDRRRWEAGVNIPFSVGPVVEAADRRAMPAIEQALAWEKVLEAPLLVEKADSYEAALAAFRRFNVRDWYLLECVFDLDSTSTLMDVGLIRKQRPDLVPVWSCSGSVIVPPRTA
jgi:hypothetical protein